MFRCSDCQKKERKAYNKSEMTDKVHGKVVTPLRFHSMAENIHGAKVVCLHIYTEFMYSKFAYVNLSQYSFCWS